jgi:tRNA(Ile)-lysidine synthase
MHPLAQRLLSHIRRWELLHAGARVGVAVSGGIDSVALLRLLLELRSKVGIVLSVVHFNHKLRGAESDADQEFVARLSGDHGLEFFVDSDDVAQHAAEERVSVETAARELRYGFFRYLLGEELGSEPQGLKRVSGSNPNGVAGSRSSNLNKIATGHTLDDQAETVLMRVVRGAGTKGISGIYPRIDVENDEGQACGEIIRPLLEIRRCELEQYLNDLGQSWREDSTNANQAFTRNRVRQLLIPMLEKEFNPAVAENLSELAEIARGEEDYWENEVAGWMGTGIHWFEPDWANKEVEQSLELIQIDPVSNPFLSLETRSDSDPGSKVEAPGWLVMNASVDLLWFLGELKAVQRRIIKAIGEHAGIPLEFKHVEEILEFATEPDASGKELSLPLGWKLLRETDQLVFATPGLRKHPEPADYEYELPVPGSVVVHEAQAKFEAQVIPVEARARYNPDNLLDADSVPRQLRVRNWRPGDRFWPAHTKAPKKIKELLQKRHIAQQDRRLWPVVASDGEIFWVRGFPSAKKNLAKSGKSALLISETPIVGQADPDFSNRGQAGSS